MKKLLAALAVMGLVGAAHGAAINIVSTNTIPANTNLQARVINWMDSKWFPVGPAGGQYQTRMKVFATMTVSNAIKDGVKSYEDAVRNEAARTNSADGVIQ